jgi:hypothetical protein
VTSRRVTTTRSRGSGLTAAGAVTLALLLSLAGAVYDVLTGPGLRAVFAVCFVTGCVLAAVLVRRRAVWSTVVLLPLVYVAVALVAGAVRGTGAVGSWLTRQALDLLTALVLQAPSLLTGTAAAAVVAVVRSAARRRRPAAQPPAYAPAPEDHPVRR